jgi:hypothetical protein
MARTMLLTLIAQMGRRVADDKDLTLHRRAFRRWLRPFNVWPSG